MLCPPLLRGSKLAGLLLTMVAPLDSLHRRMLSIRERRLRELTYNGQRCNLKRALNDLYGYTDYANGFEIVDVEVKGRWLWAVREVNTHDASRYEFSEDFPNYVWATDPPVEVVLDAVLCPPDLPQHGGHPGDDAMRALVNAYKPPYFNPRYAYK